MHPIEVCQLTQTLHGRPVLEQLDLTIAAGEIVGIMGANGIGKTTLLLCLAACRRPTSGQIRWFGCSPHRRPSSHRLMGFAGHDSFVYPELSARENLLFAARMQGLADPKQHVTRWLDSCGFHSQRDLAAGRLSKGWRQRLSIARAIIHDPPLVILDEPFSGLDADGCDWLEQRLLDMRGQGRSVCFTAHNSLGCRGLVDRCLELRQGMLHARVVEPLRPWVRSA